jgi:hypothetical protein
MSNEEGSFAEEMIFDANLREFAHRVGIVCSLESGGKISQAEAYSRIKELWKQLKRSRKNLQISDKTKGSGSSTG